MTFVGGSVAVSGALADAPLYTAQALRYSVGGRTRLRGRSICPTVEARDALLSSGMKCGMTEGYKKLDDLLNKL
jgi:hypothetical protein